MRNLKLPQRILWKVVRGGGGGGGGMRASDFPPFLSACSPPCHL